MGGHLAVVLAHSRRLLRDLALLRMAGAPGVARAGAARAHGDAAQPAADRRPDDVLLPVPRPGRVLLRRAALPLGRARPVRARDGRAAAAALGDAPRRRDRDPALLPARVGRAWSSASGVLSLLAGTVVLLGALDADCRAGDRVRADAARRPRHRRARLAARRRHRLGRPGRREPGGRRRPEHDDEPRRLARDGAGGLAADRVADLGVPDQRRAEPRDPGQREAAGAGRARRRRPVRLRRRSRGCARRCRGRAGDHRGDARRPTADARLEGLRAALAILAVLAVIALFLAQLIPTRPAGIEERKE